MVNKLCMKMEITNHPSKLVKPSKPTPPILRNYTISFIDELAPTNKIPLILYYYAPPDFSPQKPHNKTICDHLEASLSETLCEFYPFAGRYTRYIALVDCSDQGVPYVLANTNVPLSKILGGLGRGFKPDLLNDFLPCEIGETKDGDDPMLSIKVTTFGCGGLAIGMCFSHRIIDVATLCTFINNWVSRSKRVYEVKKYSPVFNSTLYFPPKDLPKLYLGPLRPSISAHVFRFNRDAIFAMGKTVGYGGTMSQSPSKVQLVVALLWKAFVRIDKANNGQSKASFIAQPIELRKKLDPQLPTNSFGNFWGLITSQLKPGKGENIGFQGFYKILSDSVKKANTDCSKIAKHGEEGHHVIIDSYLESNRNVVDDDVNFYLFTSLCYFSFYKADFGWGKPVWASQGKYPIQNLVVMMDDQEGGGVEAWVHLNEKCMRELEQDSDIKKYNNTSFSQGKNTNTGIRSKI
ncbi:hypothetical protein E3N88_09059 [Mikania micrantha]|uniref:Uncharacterized protein n=1 Tax=Mikania micrantha TaxID=192012 RepID=A0A5N6PKA7_9ASTR|nr:hypothetical protein E3N88_09059 [Mikania micrantha]